MPPARLHHVHNHVLHHVPHPLCARAGGHSAGSAAPRFRRRFCLQLALIAHLNVQPGCSGPRVPRPTAASARPIQLTPVPAARDLAATTTTPVPTMLKAMMGDSKPHSAVTQLIDTLCSDRVRADPPAAPPVPSARPRSSMPWRLAPDDHFCYCLTGPLTPPSPAACLCDRSASVLCCPVCSSQRTTWTASPSS